MQTTGNLGLKKPDGTDIVDIADLNGNMDKLDTEVVKLATTTGNGRMSAADKVKLNGIAAGANNYTHPNHTGDVTSTGDGVTAIAPGVIVNADINAAAAIDASKIGTGVVSNAEFGYLDGVTSGIQAQLNARPVLTTTPQQTTGNITYYVRTDGNDSNNGLANTAGGAFNTIAKAISMIPQVVNHNVIVNVAAGTYGDNIDLSGYSGSGEIKIMGAATLVTTHTTSSIAITRNSCRINVTGFVFSRAAGNAVFSCAEVVLASCTISSTASTWGFFADSSKVYFIGCSVSNRSPAFQAHTNSEVLLQTCSGSGNGYSITAAYGGKAILDSSTIASTYKYSAYAGGIIIENGSGVINPWGDNTTSTRSRVEAGPNGVQSLLGNTFSKVLFTTEYVDVKGEYDSSNARFIVKETGVYLFCPSIRLIGVATDSIRGIGELWINGGMGKAGFFDSTMGGGFDFTIAGSVAFALSAGDTVDVYAYTSVARNVDTYTAGTFLRIVRVA